MIPLRERPLQPTGRLLDRTAVGDAPHDLVRERVSIRAVIECDCDARKSLAASLDDETIASAGDVAEDRPRRVAKDATRFQQAQPGAEEPELQLEVLKRAHESIGHVRQRDVKRTVKGEEPIEE